MVVAVVLSDRLLPDDGRRRSASIAPRNRASRRRARGCGRRPSSGSAAAASPSRRRRAEAPAAPRSPCRRRGSSLTSEFVCGFGPGRLEPQGNSFVPGHGAGFATSTKTSPSPSKAGGCQRPPPLLMSVFAELQRSSGTVQNFHFGLPVSASSAHSTPAPVALVERLRVARHGRDVHASRRTHPAPCRCPRSRSGSASASATPRRRCRLSSAKAKSDVAP